jgi:hypothetical protein
MNLKSQFSLSQSSGFVAFDGGGSVDAEVRPVVAKTAVVETTPRLEPELRRAPAVVAPSEWLGSRTWQPSTSALVRRVEGAVLAAICAYFAFGLAGVAGWL